MAKDYINESYDPVIAETNGEIEFDENASYVEEPTKEKWWKVGWDSTKPVRETGRKVKDVVRIASMVIAPVKYGYDASNQSENLKYEYLGRQQFQESKTDRELYDSEEIYNENIITGTGGDDFGKIPETFEYMENGEKTSYTVSFDDIESDGSEQLLDDSEYVGLESDEMDFSLEDSNDTELDVGDSEVFSDDLDGDAFESDGSEFLPDREE